ncbi:MAG: ferredoxin, partial [Methanosarcinaceae archaeon]
MSEEYPEELSEQEAEETGAEETGAEEESQDKITVTTTMDLQGSHFLYTQATEKSIKTIDYDYKRCNG